MSALCQKQTRIGQIDHLGGAGKQRRRNGQAKRLGGREVDHELEFGRLRAGRLDGDSKVLG